MAFWNSAQLEPKKSYQYTVTMKNIAEPFLIKSAKLPSMEIGTLEADYTQYKFYYPGKVTWTPVEFTIYDVVGNSSVAKKLVDLLKATGVQEPKTAQIGKATFSKNTLSTQLGSVVISQMDTAGTEIGKWTLTNTFLTSVDFGQHGYSDEGLIEVTVSIQYDWAAYTPTGA
jgi:hypothetical protein